MLLSRPSVFSLSLQKMKLNPADVESLVTEHYANLPTVLTIMNAEEAKFVLSSIRPDGRDAAGPMVAEALSLAENDAELKAWLEDSNRFDQAVSQKLREIAPPAELKTFILAGVKASRARSLWRNRRALFAITAAAAALTLLATVPALMTGDSSGSGDGSGATRATGEMGAFRASVLAEIEDMRSLDFDSDDQGRIEDWLRGRGALAADDAPSGVEALPAAGCKVLNWKGTQISLICFRARPGDLEPSVHLVVVDSRLLPELAEGGTEIEVSNGWTTAVWRRGSQTYLLATKGDESEIRRLISLG